MVRRRVTGPARGAGGAAAGGSGPFEVDRQVVGAGAAVAALCCDPELSGEQPQPGPRCGCAARVKLVSRGETACRGVPVLTAALSP